MKPEPLRLTWDMLDALQERAAGSERRRANHNVHPVLEDPVQRFFNAVEPDSYVRPHRHKSPLRWEFFIILRGKVVMLTFDDAGRVLSRTELDAAGETFGVEVPAGSWHSLVAKESSVLFELKEGPYHALTDKDFATWAPEEGGDGAQALVEWYRQAQPGDAFPGA